MKFFTNPVLGLFTVGILATACGDSLNTPEERTPAASARKESIVKPTTNPPFIAPCAYAPTAVRLLNTDFKNGASDQAIKFSIEGGGCSNQPFQAKGVVVKFTLDTALLDSSSYELKDSLSFDVLDANGLTLTSGVLAGKGGVEWVSAPIDINSRSSTVTLQVKLGNSIVDVMQDVLISQLQQKPWEGFHELDSTIQIGSSAAFEHRLRFY